MHAATATPPAPDTRTRPRAQSSALCSAPAASRTRPRAQSSALCSAPAAIHTRPRAQRSALCSAPAAIRTRPRAQSSALCSAPAASRIRPRAQRLTAVLLLAHAAAACTATSTGGGNLDPTNTPPPVATGTTYQGATRAIFETHCTSCHAPGGIAPFSLTDYATAAAHAASILAEVDAGTMPPWLPSATCKTYRDERRLSDADRAAIESWVAAGAPEGDLASYVAPAAKPSALESMGPPSLTLQPADAYTPSTAQDDDYHCFPLDHEFTEETYLVMSDVVPGHREIVHHVIVFLVPPQSVPQLQAKDDAEPGLGYTCFGGPGTANPQNIAAWVPGAVVSPLDPGTATRIPAGSRLVMQIHYNTVFAPREPDRTQLNLWFSAERPQNLLTVKPFPHLAIDIAAGDPASHQTREFKNNSTQTWTAVAAAPHMHLLGTQIGMTAIRQDGGEECIVDIQKWNFHWQQSYRFLSGETLEIPPGDSVRLDCIYDNSAAHQPVVDGAQQAPREVRWGEGTLDEMCLGYLALVEPYAPLPPPGSTCPGFQDCYDRCTAGSTPKTACALQCSNSDGQACTECVVPGVVQCVNQDCGAETSGLLTCVDSCQNEADPKACVRRSCVSQLLAFDRCAAPKITANECDSYVAGCGADL